MHKVGELGVGIGEIDLEIADVSEIFENFDKCFLPILGFKPIPDFLCCHLLYLVPNANVEAQGKDSLGLGVIRGIVVVLLLPRCVFGLPDSVPGAIGLPLVTSSGWVGGSSGLEGRGVGSIGYKGAIDDSMTSLVLVIKKIPVILSTHCW